MAPSAVKGVKVSSRGVSGNSWATPVEALKIALSQSLTGIGVSTVDCRNVSLLE